MIDYDQDLVEYLVKKICDRMLVFGNAIFLDLGESFPNENGIKEFSKSLFKISITSSSFHKSSY